MSVEGSGDGNEFSLKHQVVISQSFGSAYPPPQSPVSGFTYLQPQPYIISESKYHLSALPGASYPQADLTPNSGYAPPTPVISDGHPSPVISDGHPSSHHPGPPQHLLQLPTTSYYMNQIPASESNLMTHPPNHLCIKQEPGLIVREIPFNSQFAVPFINGESEQVSQSAPFKQEPGTVPFIKQEPGTVPFIKQEPGTVPFIKQEPGTVPFIKQEPGTEQETVITSIKQEPYWNTVQSPSQYGHSLSSQEVASVQCGVSFPSQPLNLNFMADIEDIVQPSMFEVSIDSIKNELASFDGPSDAKSNVRVVREEVDEEPWEPALWKKQYENIRTMRAKRDAPVDKYGCFMNAEKEVAPEVRRYQVLVSLMMSSQTKDEVVGKAMTKLKENGLTVSNVLDTPQEEIARMIFPVGFWNKKADYIKKTTKILKEKFGGDIPDSVEGLVSLPGIGPKMAHLIMDFAWGQVSGIAVDTHVHRITHRMGWMKKEARNPEEARKCLEKWFPKEEWSDLNLLCVGFGQQICSPVGPKCSECLNKDLCPSSSCLVSSGLPLGIGFEVSTKSKKKTKSSPMAPKGKTKKIKIEQ